MKFKNIMCKIGTKVTDDSPVIFLVTGIIAGAASIVAACAKTKKASEAIEEAKNDVYDINEDFGVVEGYTEADMKKDLKKTYAKMAGKIVKAYLPAAGLEVLSVACTITSYANMDKRNKALADQVNKLTASLSALSIAFSEYRARVAARFGKDVEYDIAHGINRTTETITKDDGTTEEIERVTYEGNLDPKAILWGRDGICHAYDLVYGSDAATKISHLQEIQSMVNQDYRKYGHMSLGEVKEKYLFVPAENIPECDYTEFGWVRGYGDDFIDFGLTTRDFYSENQNRAIRAWLYGEDDAIFIQFNCLGGYLNKRKEAGVMLR